jgi:hypothetical protein
MSYDPVKGHPEARLVCDLLRSVIGSSCSQQPWHTAIDISQLEPVDQDLTESIMAWLRELVEEECAHTVEIDRSARDIHLKLQVDASFFGHGSCILFRTGTDHEWRVVQADASAWKKKEIAYSINRLEALALLIALQKLASFLQQFHSSTFGQQRTFRITVECDNATAIAWATKGPSSLVEKSVERRAIMRLCDALNEELQEIGKLSTLELKHLEGTQNSTADKLSRLMERQAISKQGIPITIGKLFRQRYEKLKINAVKEEPESLVAGRSLVEEIAGSAWSLSDSIATFSRLRALLRRWGSRGGDGAQTEQDERAFYMEVQSLLSNPRMYSMIDGVAHLVHNRHDGTQVSRVVIPKAARALQQLIFRTFHRLNGHRGARHTLADLARFFHLEGASRTARYVIANCIVCTKKNARFVEPVLPAAVFQRHLDLPVLSRVAIDHVYVRPTCLSVICIDTSYFCLVPVPDLTTSSAIEALQRIAHRYSVTFVSVHSDSYSAFASRQLEQELRVRGHVSCTTTTTTKGASQTNPVERLHRELWSILRCRKFCSRMTEALRRAKGGEEMEGILDEICYIINSRPLGYDETDKSAITPATLAFGRASAEGRSISERLREVREYFYNYCFDDLRRRHIKVRRVLTTVGQKVLAHIPSKYKGDFPVVAGEVCGIDGAKISVRSAGKIYEVSSQQILPLKKFETTEEAE